MKRVIILIVILLLIAGGAVAAWGYLKSNPTVVSRSLLALNLESAGASKALEASGTIEAEEVSIVAEIGGRVVEVAAGEGDEVKRGATLVRLDTALLEAQIGEARAAVETARADLAQVEAGPRLEEVAAAEAALAQAQVQAEGALAAWRNALDMRDNPLDLNAQIDEARTQVGLAEEEIAQAEAQLNIDTANRDRYQFDTSEEGKTAFAAFSKQVKGAEAALEAARAARDGAQEQLNNLLEMRNNPLVLDSQVNAARAQYEVARQGVEVARAALEVTGAGPREEEVAVARARVHQAEAALGLLEAQREKMILKSPIDGLVTSKAVHEGEIAISGATLLTVADLETVTLTVYIPEDEIGKVKVGQRAIVSVDSFPDLPFEGWVSYIASEAEFTPKNVQTKKERVNMVFAVKVKLPNPDHALKPGMPADAKIDVVGKVLASRPTVKSTATATATPTVTSTPTPWIIYVTATPPPTPTATPSPPTVTTALRPRLRAPSGLEMRGKIAFTVLNRDYRPRPLHDLYIANVDGSGRRLVAQGMRQPDIRGDGIIVANGEGLNNQESLFVMRIDGSGKQEVSQNANDVRPIWSPDGGRLLYTNLHRNELVIQNGGFRDATKHVLRYDITTLVGRHPTWIDNRRIVYNGCDVWFSDGGCGLYLTDETGRMEPRRLTDNPTDVAPAAFGERIAFMSRRDGNWEIYAVNTDGTGLTRLTDDPADDGLPAWEVMTMIEAPDHTVWMGT
ncbi:MAG: efflux RND transporter periplasmic adaptor subunit, partial [Anaerolineae bacterium]